jgi:hypothetical protein
MDIRGPRKGECPSFTRDISHQPPSVPLTLFGIGGGGGVSFTEHKDNIMAARGTVQDFITQVNAKPGYSVNTNVDGSLAISKLGVVKFVSVFWNIQWGNGAPGPASRWGYSLCEIVYTDGTAPLPNDNVTILRDGQSGSGAYTQDAQAFLDGLN